MLFATAEFPVYGTTLPTFSPILTTPAPQPEESSDAAPDAFASIVALYQSTEYLLNELKSVKAKLVRATSYLETPGSHPVLARVHIDRLKARRSAVLTLLRANRLQSRALLDGLDAAGQA